MSRSLLVFVALFAVACSGPSSGSDDGGTAGAGACADAGSLDVCNPPACYTGNDKGVGMYCTAGGGECDALDQQYGGAYGCGIDLDPQGSDFCVRLFCQTNEDCGADACCTGRGDSGPRACVPRLCVVDQPSDPCPPLPDGSDGGTNGVDGGSGSDSDAGM